jgi:hypothetical protein
MRATGGLALLGAVLLAGCGGAGTPRQAARWRLPVPRLPAAPAVGPSTPLRALVLRPTALRAAPGGPVVGWIGLRTGYGTRRALAVVARRGGWVAVRAAERPNASPGWIRAAAARIEPVRWSLLADLHARTLTVRRAGRVIARYRVSIGAPSTPTPTGRFGVTDRLLVPPGSPYGYGILALSGHQPHLPTGWSGGDRLAVHGTPDESTIGDADTNGCLHASTRALQALLREIPIGTTLTVRA